MRCCDGLPQQVWHHTSVFARSPFTVLLNTLSMNSGLITLSTIAARRQQVDLRLLHLNHRAAGVGQVVQLLVERVADGHDPRRDVLVVLVLHRERHQLGRDRAELHRLAVSRCAALKISAYCISPRPTGPTSFGITRASR